MGWVGGGWDWTGERWLGLGLTDGDEVLVMAACPMVLVAVRGSRWPKRAVDKPPRPHPPHVLAGDAVVDPPHHPTERDSSVSHPVLVRRVGEIPVPEG